MNFNIIIYIGVFLLAALLSLLLTYFSKKIAKPLGLVDLPSERRIHSEPIPRSGGIGVALSFYITILLLFLIILYPNVSSPDQSKLQGFGIFILGSLGVLILGIIDDRFNIRAWVKLFFQVFIATLMFYAGISFDNLLGISLHPLINLFSTVFWIVLLTNAFNLIDGMDGVCSGLGVLSSLSLGILLVVTDQPIKACILFILAGSCLGFLKHNFHPASIFLGDAGSMFIGFIIAVLSLVGNVGKSAVVSILVPLLIVGVPIFDVILAVWRRLARRILYKIEGIGSESKVFGADLDHLHHRLAGKYSQKKAASYLYLAALGISLIALGSVLLDNYRAGILLLGGILFMYVLIRRVIHIEYLTTAHVILKGISRPKGIRRKFIHVIYDSIILFAFYYFIMLHEAPRYQVCACLKGWDLSLNCLIITAFIATVIPVIILSIANTYKTIWSFARIFQYSQIFIALIIGELLTVLTFYLIFEANVNHALLFGLIRISYSFIFIVIGRSVPKLTRDSSSFLRKKLQKDNISNAIILGNPSSMAAYFRYQLDKHETLKKDRNIIGLLINSLEFKDTIVYGYPVIGNYDKVNDFIKSHSINEIIICDSNYLDIQKNYLLNLTEQNIEIKIFKTSLTELHE